jgi:hypothetical protein
VFLLLIDCLQHAVVLRWLYLYNNELTGTVPEELGNLAYLQCVISFDSHRWLWFHSEASPLTQITLH